MKLVEDAIKWLEEDMAKEQPCLTHTLFSGQELKQAASLEIEDSQIPEFMSSLEQFCMITHTNKLGEHGLYYNVNAHSMAQVHVAHEIKAWLQEQVYRRDGFCITLTKYKIYTLICEATKCPFYFVSERRCIQGKFFIA